MTGIMSSTAIYAIPVVLITIIMSGLLNNVKLFDEFIVGAKDGLKSMVGIVPNLIGLLVAVAVFRASGGLGFLINLLRPVTDVIGILPETLPLALMRPISGSASLAVLSDIFKSSGPDSIVGQVASVVMGSTETILYTVAVYLGAVGVKNSRYAIPLALVVDVVGFFVATLLCKTILW